MVRRDAVDPARLRGAQREIAGGERGGLGRGAAHEDGTGNAKDERGLARMRILTQVPAAAQFERARRDAGNGLGDDQIEIGARAAEQFAESRHAAVEFGQIPDALEPPLVAGGKAQPDSVAAQQHHVAAIAGKIGKWAEAATSATLTRQRNGSPSAGMRSASGVTPPPFFQGRGTNEDCGTTCIGGILPQRTSGLGATAGSVRRKAWQSTPVSASPGTGRLNR